MPDAMCHVPQLFVNAIATPCLCLFIVAWGEHNGGLSHSLSHTSRHASLTSLGLHFRASCLFKPHPRHAFHRALMSQQLQSPRLLTRRLWKLLSHRSLSSNELLTFCTLFSQPLPLCHYATHSTKTARTANYAGFAGLHNTWHGSLILSRFLQMPHFIYEVTALEELNTLQFIKSPCVEKKRVYFGAFCGKKP